MGHQLMARGIELLNDKQTTADVAAELNVDISTANYWLRTMRAAQGDARLTTSAIRYLCRANTSDIIRDDPPGVQPARRRGSSRYWDSLAHYAAWAEAAGAPALDPARVAMFGGVMPIDEPEAQPELVKQGALALQAATDSAKPVRRRSIIGAVVECCGPMPPLGRAVVHGWWSAGASAYLLVQDEDGQLVVIPATSCRVVDND